MPRLVVCPAVSRIGRPPNSLTEGAILSAQAKGGEGLFSRARPFSTCIHHGAGGSGSSPENGCADDPQMVRIQLL